MPSLDDLLPAVRALSLGDKIALRSLLRETIQLEAAALEAERQRDCLHLRAKESQLSPDWMTWYCPDCKLVTKHATHRDRGTV